MGRPSRCSILSAPTCLGAPRHSTCWADWVAAASGCWRFAESEVLSEVALDDCGYAARACHPPHAHVLPRPLVLSLPMRSALVVGFLFYRYFFPTIGCFISLFSPVRCAGPRAGRLVLSAQPVSTTLPPLPRFRHFSPTSENYGDALAPS